MNNSTIVLLLSFSFCRLIIFSSICYSHLKYRLAPQVGHNVSEPGLLRPGKTRRSQTNKKPKRRRRAPPNLVPVRGTSREHPQCNLQTSPSLLLSLHLSPPSERYVLQTTEPSPNAPKMLSFLSPSLFFLHSCLYVWSQPTWIGINLGWNDNYPVTFNSDVMKWETGNVININGISSAFDWEQNWIRLHKLGRIVNSVPSLLRDSRVFMPLLSAECWIKHIAADNYQIPLSIPRLYVCCSLVWNFVRKIRLPKKELRSFPPLPQQKPWISVYLVTLSSTWTKNEFVVLKHIWCWEINDSAQLTVASSNPVMLAVPQLMYGADSWRAALCCLDLFNPADQPSDRSMCAGNRCQMRSGQLLET